MPSAGIKKQKTFGYRRHIARPRTFLGANASEKRQSSLTQLDFVSTPRPSDDVISIPSSDQEDDEFVEEQPKKRRRLSGKGSEDEEWGSKAKGKTSARRRSSKIKQEKSLEKGQQTMTQMDFVPSTRVEDDIEDDYDLEIDTRDWTRRSTDRSSNKPSTKRKLPWLDQRDDEPKDGSNTSSTSSPRVESTYKVPQDKMPLPPDLALHSIATHDFTTPKKTKRHLEIPSSQSPPSIKLSPSRSQRSERRFAPLDSPSKAKSPRRSPLKEKSVNIAPSAWQPETQESQPVRKMLQQVHMRKKFGMAPLHEEAPMPPPKAPQQGHSQVESLQATRRTNAKQSSPRKLKRTATVQDSQAEDENIATQMPPPKLNRTSTVQDSQYEDLDFSSQIYRSLSNRSLDRCVESQAYINDDNDNESDDPGPHTFDPVSAALDRDAARYAWTQTQDPRTQLRRTQIADSEAESDEDETYDDDLDRGVAPVSDSEDEVVLLPNPTQGPSQELCSDDVAASKHDNHGDTTGTPTVHANENRKSRSNSNSPPSSPPPLRPSQVSTIVPTQSSPHHRAAALRQEQEENEEYSPPTSPPRPFSPANKTATQALTISSSPLPLPPWSSSNEMDADDARQSKEGRTKAEPESFVDFSLPPPPPLGTASSGWQQ